MTSDFVFPEDEGTGASDGDYADAANFAALANQLGAFVDTGLSVTVDYGVPSVDIGAGKAFVTDTSANAAQSAEARDQGVSFVVEAESRSGLSLTDNAVNHVYLDVDLTADDSISYTINTTGNAPSDPSLKVAEIDTDAQVVDDSINRGAIRISDLQAILDANDNIDEKYLDISEESVTDLEPGVYPFDSGDIKTGAIGSDELEDGSVGRGEVGTDAIGNDEFDNDEIQSITYNEADVVAGVGPNSEFSSINEAINYLTEERPVYGQERYKAIIELDNDFIMEEQVLVDGLDLGWIWIKTARGTNVGTVEDFVEGTQISGYERAESTNITVDDYPINVTRQEDNSRFLDGDYIAFDGGDSGTGDAYYFWFNVTDATTLSFVDSNEGDPNLDPANFSGVSSFTSVQVDIQLQDSASQVITELETAVGGVTEFNATASTNTLSVTNADTGAVDIIPEASDSEFTITRTVTPSDGSNSDTFNVSNVDTLNYTINGDLDPNLTLVRGFTYTFNLDNSGQPFQIQTTPSPYDSADSFTDGVSVTGDRQTGTITFDVPLSAPDTLYYVSENSTEMTGPITIVDEGGGQEPVKTAQEFDTTLATYNSDGTVTETFSDDATVLNGNYVELDVDDGAGGTTHHYFWFNANGGATDPNATGTGHEITLAQDATAETAAQNLQTAVNGVTNLTGTVNVRTVTATNDNVGAVNDAVSVGNYVTVDVIQNGRDTGYYVQVNLTGHGLSNGDRIRITGHDSGFEEFNYNGTWFVTNAATDTFELDYAADNDAVYDADRASNPTTAEVELPEPVPVTRAALDQTWEFFYQPAFGVARGTLPTIDCLFDMDTSGSNSYLSYKDGLCATDGGIINITPFNGFINAGGSNIYATRRSAINANDAIANGAGRMGVWAYSNSLINARRVEAKNCGLAGSGVDTGNGFDSAGRPVGNGVNATRGSLVNAEGLTTGGCQGDNVYASYGGQINLEGHSDTPTFDTASVNGQDINIDGGMVNEADGTRVDQIKDTAGNTMVQSVVATGQTTLSGGLAEFSTNISQTDATFMLALGIDDPNADAEVAGSLFWDDSAGNYEIRIRETETSVGNPTVNYDVLRVR